MGRYRHGSYFCGKPQLYAALVGLAFSGAHLNAPPFVATINFESKNYLCCALVVAHLCVRPCAGSKTKKPRSSSNRGNRCNLRIIAIKKTVAKSVGHS
jgi:hypothetical protein